MTRARLALACLLLLAGLTLTPGRTVAAERPSGAGLVVRHGDGRTLYIFVPFTEEEISGADLLQRSGLALVVAPFGSLGLAVCNLDNEGCPATDCFCHSRATPSIYWHYQRLDRSGRWIGNPVGPTSRVVRDGDVDGWLWGSGDAPLPPTSVDDIARLIRADRATPVLNSSPAPPSPTIGLASGAHAESEVTATPSARGVVAAPDGRVTPLVPEQTSRRQTPRGSLAAFGMLLALVAALTLLARRRRRMPP